MHHVFQSQLVAADHAVILQPWGLVLFLLELGLTACFVKTAFWLHPFLSQTSKNVEITCWVLLLSFVVVCVKNARQIGFWHWCLLVFGDVVTKFSVTFIHLFCDYDRSSFVSSTAVIKFLRVDLWTWVPDFSSPKTVFSPLCCSFSQLRFLIVECLLVLNVYLTWTHRAFSRLKYCFSTFAEAIDSLNECRNTYRLILSFHRRDCRPLNRPPRIQLTCHLHNIWSIAISRSFRA